MSLLIDALRQADQTRREASANTPTEAIADNGTAMVLEPLAPQTPSNPATAESSTTRRKTPMAILDEQRAAARHQFEVKQDKPSQLPLVLALGALVCVAAGLAYLWWAMQPRSQISNGNFVAPAQMVEQPLPITANSVPAINRQSAAEPAHISVADKKTNLSRALSDPPAPHPAAPQAVISMESGKPALNLKRSHLSDAAGPSPLMQAFEAYSTGDLSKAHQLYREVLRTDPKNCDALNGLGVLSMRAGYPDEARRYFREALISDPKNSVALSQILNLVGEADPINAESSLRTLIAEQPDTPALHFALGSLFARTGRWKEAQQAFFQAYTLDGKNPDILFNLAISLEHLNQTRLARQFYERSISAAKDVAASFDPAVPAKRIQQLANEPASN